MSKFETHPADDPADPNAVAIESDLQLATIAPPEGMEAAHAYRVVAKGEIDLLSAPQLTERLDSIIALGATMVVLDASHVTFLDSTGLRSIIAASNRLADSGGQLLIEGMSGAVRTVFEISGLLERYRSTAADPVTP